MKFLFRGSLCGYLCTDCSEPLSGMQVFLYLPWQTETITANAVAGTKDTFRLVTKEEKAARQNLLVATATTDAQGNFEFSVDEKYSGSAFDIDFYCGTVPHVPPKPRFEPIQFHLTTVQPQWRMQREKEVSFFKWEYCITSKWWCYIRGYYFDAWVICGHLRSCDTGAPISGASVTAWDADFITDDNLGTATTDASGHFRIDYTSIQFKQTFLSPWFNVETDPGSLTFQSGPDVYFKATLSGVPLIDETKADGRSNVGYCLCVDLCSKVNVITPGQTFPSAWTGIGKEFSSSYGSNPYSFDADGYAGSGKYAISGVIRLTGQAAITSSAGRRIEYRFLVSDVTTPNNGTVSPANTDFTKIVGKTPGLFSSSQVSTLSKNIPTGIDDDLFVYSDQTDFDADGWFDVSHAIERTLVNAGYTAADLGLFRIIDNDTLISVDTRALTSAPNVPAGTANAGDAVPLANYIPIEKVAMRFEIREVVDKATSQFLVVPGSGKTLNSIIMNNNDMFFKLSIRELEETTLCSPIHGNVVHAKYTVYHPHLSSASLHVQNNSLSVSKYVTDGFLTLSGNTSPLVTGGAKDDLELNTTTPPPGEFSKCTYWVELRAGARLHNGDTGSGEGSLTQLFFYDL